MNDEKEVVLNEQWYLAEYIDETGFYVKVKHRKIERYAFYLRFIGKWFMPCKKCQVRIKKLLQTSELHISADKATVHFLQRVDEDKNEIFYEFGLPFIRSVWLYTWKPCSNCQGKLAMIMKDLTSLIIGNEGYEHPVELNVKNEDDDHSFETLENRVATEEEKKRLGDKWVYQEIEG